MSKLFLDQKTPREYNQATFAEIFRAIQGQLNSLSESKLVAKYNAQTSVPGSVAAQVSFAVGDFIPDSNCTVRGSVAPGVAASYVRTGWRCVSPGTGATATFVEERVLTGT